MADKKRSQKSNKNNFEEHYLARKIADASQSRKIAGASESGNVVTFLGYIGKSESEEIIRLYTNIEFNEYLEIKKNDILHSEDVSNEVIEFGGTRIWVDAFSNIKRVYVEVTKQQAQFLTGLISHTHVRRWRGRRFVEGPGEQELYMRRNETEDIECTAIGCDRPRTRMCSGLCTNHCTGQFCFTINWPAGGTNC